MSEAEAGTTETKALGSRAEETFDVELLERRKGVLAVAASPLVLSLAGVVGMIAFTPRFAGLAVVFGMIGAFTSALAVATNPWARRRRVTAHASAEGVRLGDQFIPRADLTEGLVMPAMATRGPRVRLRGRRRLPVELEVREAAEGRRFIDAAGLGAGQSVASFFGMSRVYASGRNFFMNLLFMLCGPGLGIAAARLHLAPLGVLAGLVFAAAYISFFMPGRIKVGADGVVVSWYGFKRFISYADVDSAEHYNMQWGSSSFRGVELALKSGERLRVPLEYAVWSLGRAHIVEERIAEAMAAANRNGQAPAGARLLERQGRGALDWIAALRKLGAGASGGLRTASIERDALLGIVEDAHARPSDRGAAATALATELDDQARARLAAAAAATAMPKLRVALEAASKGEDDAVMAEALAELEALDAEHERERA